MQNNSLSRLAAVFAVMIGLAVSTVFAAGELQEIKPQPLTDKVSSHTLKPVKAGALRVPTITWPGDVSTVHTDQSGIFKQEGLTVELFCENDFAKQVEGVINGETPFLRGTMGMINSAAETFEKAGTELVVIYQLTWSNGGDCLVVRSGINNLTDLKGKTGVLQLYGPHMDFHTTILSRAGLTPKDVTIKWVKELTIPTYDAKGKIVDPRTAFFNDSKIDFCYVISPDAAALTSGGAEGVKGAKILFSSRSANRIIADVYAVRKDWYDANRATVEKFTHALMLGQESFDKLVKDKASNQTKYSQLLSRSADLLFGSPQATADVEGSLADCEWVGFQGNVQFFTGQNTIRNFTVLTEEIQASFAQVGLMKGKAKLSHGNLDYAALAKGLTNVDLTAVPRPSIDTTRAQQQVEKLIATELDKWDEQGSLYVFEIYFAPRQATFTAAQYKDAFEKALQLSQTFGGTLVTIEGHNNNDAINQAKTQGKPATLIETLERAARNLSYQRSVAVRQAYLDFCKAKGLTVDESQFLAVGMGAKANKFPTPTTEEEWNQNRRVVFRVKVIETELDTFRPAGK